jgi:hypothetical protein
MVDFASVRTQKWTAHVQTTAAAAMVAFASPYLFPAQFPFFSLFTPGKSKSKPAAASCGSNHHSLRWQTPQMDTEHSVLKMHRLCNFETKIQYCLIDN